MPTDIRLKRGTALALQQVNPILLPGEPCLEIDTNKIKYGDGVTSWINLPYSNPALDIVDGGELYNEVTAGIPQEIEGLVLWLQADDEATVQLVNGGVAQIIDKSNNGRHAFQTDTRYRPKYNQIINGKKVITFNPGKTALTGALDVADEFTVFVVFRPINTGEGLSENGRVLSFNRGTNTDTHSTGIIPCIINTEESFGTLINGNIVGGSSDLISEGSTYIYSVKRSSTTIVTRSVSTDPPEDYSSNPSTVPVASQLDYFSLGAARHNYSFGGFAGDIAEVIVYDRVLNELEENALIEYLQRWLIAPPTPTGLYANLMGFWSMNESNGIRYDTSSENNHLYLSGLAGYGTDVQDVTGVIGSAAQFGGGSDFLRNTTVSLLSDSFTISFWVQPTFNSTSDVFLQNWRTSPSSGQFFVGLNGASQKIVASIRTTNGIVSVTNTNSVGSNVYTYICLRYDSENDTLSLRVNDITDTVSTTGTLVTTTNPFCVGSAELGTIPPAQLYAIDALGLWNRSLTDEEVDFLYSSGDGRETLNMD